MRLVFQTIVFSLALLGSDCAEEVAQQAEQAFDARGCAYDLAIIETSRSRLQICGTIETGLLDQLVSKIDQRKIDEVVLASAGGQSSEAIKIAEYLNEQRLPLIIKGVCLSACASFISVLTENIFVEEGTLFGFHQTAFAQLGMMMESNSSTEDDTDQPSVDLFRLRAKSFAETAAFTRAGADSMALIEPFEMLSIRCIEDIKDADNQYNAFQANSRWRYVVPSRARMNEWRTAPIKGWWPVDYAALIETIRANYVEPERFVLFRFYSQDDTRLDDRRSTYRYCVE